MLASRPAHRALLVKGTALSSTETNPRFDGECVRCAQWPCLCLSTLSDASCSVNTLCLSSRVSLSLHPNRNQRSPGGVMVYDIGLTQMVPISNRPGHFVKYSNWRVRLVLGTVSERVVQLSEFQGS